MTTGNDHMIRSWLISVTACLLSIPLVAQEPVRPPVTGRWDLTLVTKAGRRAPSWLEVHWSGNRAFQFTGAFAGDTLAGSVTTPDGDQLGWSAHRAPSLERRGPVQWGRAVKLFNGTNLAGWHAVGGTNQWNAVAGVLTNTQRGGNLVTDGTYGDFKLHLEFRYPPSGNSGVYLRGRYEAQIEDSTGRETSTGGLGAIYGFLIPNENAAKGAGEWQTYDITLIGRIVTVVLNGHQVICRATIPGITGGALDSHE